VSPEDITAIEQRVSWRLGLVVHGSDGRVRCRQHKQRGVMVPTVPAAST
jgi:hypothetical protein